MGCGFWWVDGKFFDGMDGKGAMVEVDGSLCYRRGRTMGKAKAVTYTQTDKGIQPKIIIPKQIHCPALTIPIFLRCSLIPTSTLHNT